MIFQSKYLWILKTHGPKMMVLFVRLGKWAGETSPKNEGFPWVPMVVKIYGPGNVLGKQKKTPIES